MLCSPSAADTLEQSEKFKPSDEDLNMFEEAKHMAEVTRARKKIKNQKILLRRRTSMK